MASKGMTLRSTQQNVGVGIEEIDFAVAMQFLAENLPIQITSVNAILEFTPTAGSSIIYKEWQGHLTFMGLGGSINDQPCLNGGVGFTAGDIRQIPVSISNHNVGANIRVSQNMAIQVLGKFCFPAMAASTDVEIILDISYEE
jgi:DUF4097 and DUF4098 domain-containing protein YvlB